MARTAAPHTAPARRLPDAPSWWSGDSPAGYASHVSAASALGVNGPAGRGRVNRAAAGTGAR